MKAGTCKHLSCAQMYLSCNDTVPWLCRLCFCMITEISGHHAEASCVCVGHAGSRKDSAEGASEWAEGAGKLAFATEPALSLLHIVTDCKDMGP